MAGLIRDYDFHPPDDVRVFPMPGPGVRRLDDEAFVADVRYGEVIVRHYAFGEHWFKVNCTMDSNGGLIETTSPDDVPPFTFNCEIATPMVRRGDAVFAVDLWLDVLVRCDGVSHGIYDHEEFEAAIEHGWLSDREAAGAREGVSELVNLVEHGGLVEFLAGVYPFVPTSVPDAPDMQRVGLDEIPLLRAGTRPSW